MAIYDELEFRIGDGSRRKLQTYLTSALITRHGYHDYIKPVGKYTLLSYIQNFRIVDSNTVKLLQVMFGVTLQSILSRNIHTHLFDV